MPNIITAIVSPLTALAEAARGVIDELRDSPEEKAEAKAKIDQLANAAAAELHRSLEAEWSAKRDVLVAELQQGDEYTKRARPTVVYAGLVVLVLNHIILPWVAYFTAHAVPEIALPSEFWWGWSGIVATYSIGRTMEKRGVRNAVTQAITGSRPLLGA